LQLYRCGEALLAGKRPHLDKRWLKLEAISPHLKQAAMAAEDQNFIEHHGFDYEAIQEAMEYNRKHPKKTHGASTISQQTAKNVFLWPGRSWLRKGLEVYFTLLIEALWSKPRILQVYLNVAEFGEGVYGVEAASQKFFHKPAAKLTRAEAAQLIAVLPNPRHWSAANPSIHVQRRRDAILEAMSELGPQEGITARVKP
jgi:monofunctional biosynthetic peptidoglycan transglycosylase